MRAENRRARTRAPVRAYGETRDQDKGTDPVIDRPTSQYLTAEEVQRLHKNADTDARAEAIHHTLGPNSGQAAPGDHTHDGTNSALILEGLILTGSKTANPPSAVLGSIVNALVRLGATDNTT